MISLDAIERGSGWWRVHITRRVRNLGGALHSGMLIGAIAFTALLGLSGQARELFRSALEQPTLLTSSVGVTLGLMFLLSALFFFTYRHFLPPVDIDYGFAGWARVIGLLIPYVVAAAPWAGCIFSVLGMQADLATAKATITQALSGAGAGPRAEADQLFRLIETVQQRVPLALGLLAGGLVLTIASLFGMVLLARRTQTQIYGRSLQFVSLLLLLIFGLSAAAFDLQFTTVYTWLGALGTVMLVAIVLFALGGLVAIGSASLGISAWLGAAALAVLFAAGVRIQSDQSGSTVQTAQNAQQSARSDFSQTIQKLWRRKRLPLTPRIIIAAEGGGMYAATTAALFLSRQQDSNPNFEKKVLAISSISGGSIGASYFYALNREVGCLPDAQSEASRPNSLEARVSKLLLKDYLAPIVGNVPADILRKFVGLFRYTVDRSDALTSVIERACPALKVPYNRHWGNGDIGPALLLGTTWMQNGHRVVFSPFSLRQTGDGTVWSFFDVYGNRPGLFRGAPYAPTIADAAVTSARFPGALPPLSLQWQERRHNFGDGGYADASGVSTALELYQALNDAQQGSDSQPSQPNPVIVLINFDYQPVKPDNQFGTTFTDTLAPVNAILGVRGSLAGKSITRALKVTQRSKDRIYRITLRPEDLGVGLGWKISRTSYEMISLFVGRSDWCTDLNYTGDNTILRNSCVSRRLQRLIPRD